ncbi:hypothetical protein [Roseivivax sp. CAU 1753]
MAEYKAASALREHMLEGNPVTLLEAILLFGVRNPNAEFTRIKKDRFLIESREVPMANVIRRINEYAVCKVPEDLPYKEIQLTEYWIKK